MEKIGVINKIVKKKVATFAAAVILSTTFATTTLASTYKVKSGDTLSHIAAKYKISVAELKKLNGLKSDRININQTLKISAPVTKAEAKPASKTTTVKTYKVVKGDTLGKIASKYKVSINDLKSWNKLKNDKISVGQTLKVSKAATSTVTKTSAEKKPTTTTSTTNYVVKSGDTLGAISLKYDLSVAELKKLNKLSSDAIFVGQTLKVPKAAVTSKTPDKSKPSTSTKPVDYTEYVVKSGDTLGAIALEFDLSVAELKKLNRLSSDTIFVGKKLKVPSTEGKVVEQDEVKPDGDKYDHAEVVSLANSLKGIPYVWAGVSPKGFDCSGFIYYVFANAGKEINRLSTEGYYDRSFYINQPQPGDLVFFENTYKQGISHMGIYLGSNQFIHASDYGVAVSSLDSKYYKEHFESFKRFY